MTPRAERTALQLAVAVTCIVPFSAATMGILRGAAWLQPLPTTSMDSHFRYLSGLFLVMGIGFASCIPAIEAKGDRLRLLSAMVVVGGFARLWSLIQSGVPGPGHVAGLFIELGVVPLILLWQAHVARRLRP